MYETVYIYCNTYSMLDAQLERFLTLATTDDRISQLCQKECLFQNVWFDIGGSGSGCFFNDVICGRVPQCRTFPGGRRSAGRGAGRACALPYYDVLWQAGRAGVQRSPPARPARAKWANNTTKHSVTACSPPRQVTAPLPPPTTVRVITIDHTVNHGH